MTTSQLDVRLPSACRLAGTRVPTYMFRTYQEIAQQAAATIARVIRERNSQGHAAVLGLVTGSTPIQVYRELIRLHREEGLDFSNVVTFNLAEYIGLKSDSDQSLRRWMEESFFKHVNIPAKQIHFLDGAISLSAVDEHCREYERQIEAAGGIDVALLGIGRNGHLAYNEPFSVRNSRTRLARLDPITRRDAGSSFFHEENVPTSCLTAGLSTLFAARKIILVALGEHKASIIQQTIEGPISERVPASHLQDHHDTAVLIDPAAASKLASQETPWSVGDVDWTPGLIKRAVLWLCERTGKALLKLSDDDFRDHNLHQLLRHHGPAQNVAHRVFSQLMSTIEYHPGGRTPQRVICFSPHPDDDVISMGGTLLRLVEDGHDVHIAYMTSGNIAVFDHDALWLADLVAEFNKQFGIESEKSQGLNQKVRRALECKTPGECDCEDVQKIKGLIRWAEAKGGARVVGVPEENLHFLDLPFYRTGRIAKNPVGDEDVRIVRELIERVQPGQIYVAGDLSDPHGTHRVCAEAIFLACHEIEAASGSRPDTMLYRGAWQEWPLHEVEVAVPMSPKDMLRKRQAIFRHESQKDDALFPGSDPRQFWQRAEDRNRNTSDLYNRMGLPEYYAMEGFVRWTGEPL